MKSSDFVKLMESSKQEAGEKARAASHGQMHGMYIGQSRDDPENYVVIDGWSMNKVGDQMRQKYNILGYYDHNGVWRSNK